MAKKTHWDDNVVNFLSGFCLEKCIVNSTQVNCFVQPRSCTFSKISSYTDNWKLNPVVFKSILKRFPFIKVNLFADSSTSKWTDIFLLILLTGKL